MVNSILIVKEKDLGFIIILMESLLEVGMKEIGRTIREVDLVPYMINSIESNLKEHL